MRIVKWYLKLHFSKKYMVLQIFVFPCVYSQHYILCNLMYSNDTYTGCFVNITFTCFFFKNFTTFITFSETICSKYVLLKSSHKKHSVQMYVKFQLSYKFTLLCQLSHIAHLLFFSPVYIFRSLFMYGISCSCLNLISTEQQLY